MNKILAAFALAPLFGGACQRNFPAQRTDALAKQFPIINLITIGQVFGGWGRAQKEHFADGGVFDQIYARK